MVTGIKSLHPSCDISSSDILGRLWEETINSSDKYIPFIKNRSKESLCNGLTAYVIHKVYKTSFGDLVPQIVVNALEINLIIIHKMEDTNELNTLLPWHSDSLNHRCVVFFQKWFALWCFMLCLSWQAKSPLPSAHYRCITWPMSRTVTKLWQD